MKRVNTLDNYFKSPKSKKPVENETPPAEDKSRDKSKRAAKPSAKPVTPKRAPKPSKISKGSYEIYVCLRNES